MVLNNESVSYDELLRLAELPSFVNRRLQEIAILMFKGAVSRNAAKLGNYEMPVKLRET